ncbi:MAG: thioredoxin domain-containing protein [Gammaproteobacteria bacterium]|nr:thioredoxin domain-containing protein [Gammaproteobacteria bacterium]
MKKVIVFGLAMMFGHMVAAAGSAVLPNEESVIGAVNGKEVRLGDIQTRKIHGLRQELFREIENAFITEAIARLQESDAGFGDITLPPLKESEMRKFYDDNGLAQRGSYEQLAPQIKQYLTQMLRARVVYNLYKIAAQKGQVSSNMLDPGEFIVTVPVETAFIQGAKNGSVMVMEFSDFQCPFCRKVQPTIQELHKRYSDKVAFGYRHLPLSIHQEADESAIAVECAREQDKFVQMHNRLYQQQSDQSVDALKKLAKDVGVADLAGFGKCMDEERYRGQVRRDMDVAASVGITGTPAFIVGRYDREKGEVVGQILTGSQSLEAFVTVMEKYLMSIAKAN